MPEGVVHVFRDAENKQSFEDLERQTQNLSLDQSATDDNGVILAVLAVPPWMTPSDFLNFVAPVADGIAHLRIVQYVLRAHSGDPLLTNSPVTSPPTARSP